MGLYARQGLAKLDAFIWGACALSERETTSNNYRQQSLSRTPSQNTRQTSSSTTFTLIYQLSRQIIFSAWKSTVHINIYGKRP